MGRLSRLGGEIPSVVMVNETTAALACRAILGERFLIGIQTLKRGNQKLGAIVRHQINVNYLCLKLRDTFHLSKVWLAPPLKRPKPKL